MTINSQFKLSDPKCIWNKTQPKWNLLSDQWGFLGKYPSNQVEGRLSCAKTCCSQSKSKMWIKTPHISILFKLAQQVSIQSIQLRTNYPPTKTTTDVHRPILKIQFTCPLVLVGEAAASPGFSTAVSAFPAVLDSCVPIAFPSDKESQPIQKRSEQRPHKRLCWNPRLSASVSRSAHEGAKVHWPTAQTKSSEEQDFWKEQQKTGRERDAIKSPLGGHRQAAKWRNFPRC